MGQNIDQRSNKGVRTPKKILKYVLVILIIGIVGLGAKYLKGQYDSTHMCNGRENSPIYVEAANNLTQTKYQELEKTIQKIKKQDSYQKDPNCLYPIVGYYVIVGEVSNAKTAYSELEKVYNADRKFVKVYGPTVTTVNDVKAQIDTLDKVNEQFINNRQFYD